MLDPNGPDFKYFKIDILPSFKSSKLSSSASKTSYKSECSCFSQDKIDRVKAHKKQLIEKYAPKT